MFLWSDLIEAVSLRSQALNVGVPLEALAEATERAYSLVGAESWSCLLQVEQVKTESVVTKTGVSYDGNGVLAAADAWPTWVGSAGGQLGYVSNIGVVRAKKVNGTALTLHPPYLAEPASDVSARFCRTVFETLYPLRRVREATYVNTQLVAVPRVEIEDVLRLSNVSGPPSYYAVGDDHDGIRRLFLAPGAIGGILRVVYDAEPEELKVTGFAAMDYTGTIAATEGQTAVTGTGTSFSSEQVGAYLVVSRDSQPPAGRLGSRAGVVLGRVAAVASATSLTLEEGAKRTVSGNGMRISSRIDLADHIWPYLVEVAFREVCAVWKPERLAEATQMAYARGRDAKAADMGAYPTRSDGRYLWKITQPIIAPSEP